MRQSTYSGQTTYMRQRGGRRQTTDKRQAGDRRQETVNIQWADNIHDWWPLIWCYSPLSWADWLRSHVVLHEWLAFYSAWNTFFIHLSGVLTALAWLVPYETAAVSAQVLCTPYSHAPCHFLQSHIRKVYACLAVTCNLHFWQNDRDLLRATAVARGWNGYRNKSQHRKSTLEKNIIPPLLQGFEPATFQSRVRRSNHWAIPAPVRRTGGRRQATDKRQAEGRRQRTDISR